MVKELWTCQNGLEVAAQLYETSLIYEIKVPLARSEIDPRGVGAEPGDEITVGIETPKIERPSRPEGMSGRGVWEAAEVAAGVGDPVEWVVVDVEWAVVDGEWAARVARGLSLLRPWRFGLRSSWPSLRPPARRMLSRKTALPNYKARPLQSTGGSSQPDLKA